MLPITILITAALGILTPTVFASEPAFNIPVVDIPVTITAKSESIKDFVTKSFDLCIYGAAIYATHMDKTLTPSKLCGQFAVMHAIGLASTLSHELGHALVAKYCLGNPYIEIQGMPSSLVVGAYPATTQFTPYTVSPSGNTVKEILHSFIKIRKNTEQKKIIYAAAGPIVGAATAGVIGYALKDSIPLAPWIGAIEVGRNLHNLSSENPDGQIILEACQKINNLQQAEYELNALPLDYEVTMESEIWQRMLTY